LLAYGSSVQVGRLQRVCQWQQQLVVVLAGVAWGALPWHPGVL
jgi:hypothetical protein